MMIQTNLRIEMVWAFSVAFGTSKLLPTMFLFCFSLYLCRAHSLCDRASSVTSNLVSSLVIDNNEEV